VCIVKLSETLDEPGHIPKLKVAEDDDVLYRSVLIQGKNTGTDYMYATSLVVAARVPTAMLEALLYTDAPFGRLLVAHRVETLREILYWHREPAGRHSPYFGVEPTDMLLSRTYRVVSHELPVALITEKFPESHFRDA
jgi:chorismate-pyruvate lyase